MAIAAFAQPSYDDCTNAYNLGVAPACDTSTCFNNVNATTSVIFSNPADDINACFQGGTNQRDVWISFVASDTILDYTISLVGGSCGGPIAGIVQPQIAVYRGDCLPDELAELGCATSALGETSVSLNLNGLTPGFTYFIRVNDWSASATPNWGAFQLCVTPIIPDVNFCAAAGTTAPSGTLYDSGGPDENYLPDEDCTFTICPNEPSACLTFIMIYYNIEAGFGGSDQMLFFDGPDANSPNIGQLSGGTGDNNGGGVCFSAQATSGCMTIQFISNGNVELEGFMGEWENSQQACPESGNLEVVTAPTFNDIENALETPFTTVTVTDINCGDTQYGTFAQGETTDLGAKKGLLLTSGSAVNVPNTGDFFSSEATFTGTDPDLNYLSTVFGNGNTANDVCIVELDVFAAADVLSFEYVFGSEEYPEYVNSNFNDIFAFFISGPGIVGDPLMNNQENMATLPFDGTTPVQINSVNNQTNWEYYRQNNNIGGFNDTYSNLSGQSIVYDGLTSDSMGVKKTLTAQRNVTPCNTYHLKLAIADRGDTAFDSGVFVSEISAGLPEITVNFQNGIDYLLEGCTTIEEQLIIGLTDALDDTLSFHVNISGTATQGLDYTLNVPSVITFLPGQTSFSYPLGTITDLIDEPNGETVIITLSNNFGCGDVVYSQVEIAIEDEPKIIAVDGQDSTYACEGSTVDLFATGAAVYIWTPFSVLDNEGSATPTFTGSTSQWIYVTGQVGLCVGHDSVYVQIIDPEITVASTDYQICTQESAILTAFDNVNHSNLVWTPAIGLTSPDSDMTEASPDVTTTYTAKVTIAGCDAEASLTINVDEFTFPQIYTTDTTVCQGYAFFLGSTVTNTTTQYSWTPSDLTVISDPNFSGPIATPNADTQYILVATSQNGYCSQTATVDVTVIEAAVDILGTDAYEICLGDTVVFGTQVNSAGVGTLSWSTYDMDINGSTAPLVFATPDQSYWYYANYDVDGCSVVDSAYIRVDSIPSLALSLSPVQSIYCTGQVVTIFSPTYDPFGFPDMTHAWSPDTYTQSPVDQFNLVVTPEVTTTYTRLTSNKACSDSASITINVIDPTFDITASDTIICSGGTVQITATQPYPNTTFEWSPVAGLSCTDCPNPVVTMNAGGSVTYTATATTGDCESTGTITIYAIDPAFTISADDPSVCLGETIQLTATPPTPVTTFVWSPATGLSCTNCPNPTANLATGNYTFNVIATTGNCSSTGNIDLSVGDPTFVLTAADTSVCPGETVQLTATPSATTTTFEWSPADGLSCTDCPNPVATVTNGPILYTVTSTSGDCSETDNVTLYNDSVIAIEILATPSDSILTGSPVVLTANTNPDVSVGGLFAWSTGQTGYQITVIPVDEFNSYTVNVQSPDGCESTAIINFAATGPQYFIPNSFSPNGDELNTHFNVFIAGENPNISIATLDIYDRWGQRVYSNNQPLVGWDGTFNGKDMPSEVYMYHAVINLPGGKQEVRKGDLTLIR